MPEPSALAAAPRRHPINGGYKLALLFTLVGSACASALLWGALSQQLQVLLPEGFADDVLMTHSRSAILPVYRRSIF